MAREGPPNPGDRYQTLAGERVTDHG
jgi:hypothetical protein